MVIFLPELHIIFTHELLVHELVSGSAGHNKKLSSEPWQFMAFFQKIGGVFVGQV